MVEHRTRNAEVGSSRLPVSLKKEKGIMEQPPKLLLDLYELGPIRGVWFQYGGIGQEWIVQLRGQDGKECWTDWKEALLFVEFAKMSKGEVVRLRKEAREQVEAWKRHEEEQKILSSLVSHDPETREQISRKLLIKDLASKLGVPIEIKD